MRRAEKVTKLTDLRAEVRAGMVRMLMAAALGLATLYIISKTGDALDDTSRRSFIIALLAVGAYLVLALVSVIMVWTRLYRGWMAWFFTLSEVFLLSSCLFFQVQGSGADSMTALSSPAASAIAVALVLQILYRRPGLQVFSMLALIGATTAIVAFRASPDDVFDTNTVQFLQQNYTGMANAVRLFALFLIAVIVGTAVVSSRRDLSEVEAAADKHIDMARFVPDELLNLMKDEEFPPIDDGRIAELVVMVVELRGFTAMRHELGAEDATRLLGEFRERVSKSAANWNGVVEQFTGSNAQVIFGLQGSTEAAARSAVDAALSLMDEFTSWNTERGRKAPPVHHVTAIHAGELLVGIMGNERRREFSAVGAAINDTYQIASVAIQKDLMLVASEPILNHSGIDTSGPDWLDLEMGIRRADRNPVRLYGLNVH